MRPNPKSPARKAKQRPPRKAVKGRTHGQLPPALIELAMDLERRTMLLYCHFERLFPEPLEVRRFWFEMARHESRHFGALALVGGLLAEAPDRSVHPAPSLTRPRMDRLRRLLSRVEADAKRHVTLSRAFEIALEVEGSEIEDVVLDLLSALRGESERNRALHLLIHDLGDLSYMIEKYTDNRVLLARADRLIEQQVGRLRRRPTKQDPGRSHRR